MWSGLSVYLSGDRESALLGWVEAEIPELPTPIGVWIPQTFDVDAAGEASFDRCLDELGSKERK